MEDEDSGIRAAADPAAGNFTERVAGGGYQETADKLGHKTHSAAVKRMEAIKRRFIQYEEGAGR